MTTSLVCTIPIGAGSDKGARYIQPQFGLDTPEGWTGKVYDIVKKAQFLGATDIVLWCPFGQTNVGANGAEVEFDQYLLAKTQTPWALNKFEEVCEVIVVGLGLKLWNYVGSPLIFGTHKDLSGWERFDHFHAALAPLFHAGAGVIFDHWPQDALPGLIPGTIEHDWLMGMDRAGMRIGREPGARVAAPVGEEAAWTKSLVSYFGRTYYASQPSSAWEPGPKIIHFDQDPADLDSPEARIAYGDHILNTLRAGAWPSLGDHHFVTQGWDLRMLLGESLIRELEK